jgi:hypothetical protein
MATSSSFSWGRLVQAGRSLKTDDYRAILLEGDRNMAGHRNRPALMAHPVLLGLTTALARLAGERSQVRLPDPDIGADSLPARKKAQL